MSELDGDLFEGGREKVKVRNEKRDAGEVDRSRQISE